MLTESDASALSEVISSLADNKAVLGRRYGEWCTGAPVLEAAVAAAAMAQDELGHARSLYPLLGQLAQGQSQTASQEPGWHEVPTHVLGCLDHPFGSWIEFVATNFVVDTAFTVFIQACHDSAFIPLAQRARKILQEEQVHWAHAHGWVKRLAAGEPGRTRLTGSIEGCWEEALAWYGSAHDESMVQLHAAGLIDRSVTALGANLVAQVSAVLLDAEIEMKLTEAAHIHWQRWSASGRRLAPR